MDSNKKICPECKGKGWKRKGYAILQGGRFRHLMAWGPCKNCLGTGLTYKNIHELNINGTCAI